MCTRTSRCYWFGGPGWKRVLCYRCVCLLYVLFVLGVVMLLPAPVECGCRRLAQKPCEAICVRPNTPNRRTLGARPDYGVDADNVSFPPASSDAWTCELRIVVIMPANTSVQASLPRVHPVLEKAEDFIRREGIFPADVAIRWIPFDDRCEQARATVMAMDGTGSDYCGHLILGPSCDFALAPVARIARYIYNDGIPVITGAGYTFDFEEPKTHCENEFHMLFRTGLVSFKRMAFFMIELIRHFKWNRVVYFYDRHSYYNVAGPQTGHLLMNTMAEFFRHENITYSPFSTDSARTNFTESLKEKVGLSYASKCFVRFAQR
ncbi:atrial natriuretic peptide receptor 3 [Anopheles marshallii]|uniref:atrial natriuretic peptide receptor 3 n=1 Tax=Anopheles marshallii TaxID=1521116 RepID=UPI00237B973B|nr:atrial natriuretic peptide receptor 3 [Anopheles marshallii]